MIKFNRKNFSGKTETISKSRKAIQYLKDHPTVPISAAALGVSTANLGVNTRRHAEAQKYQEKQLKAMENQTRVIAENTKALREAKPITTTVINKPAKSKRFKFFSSKKEKEFSIKTGAIEGAKIGAGIAGMGTVFLPKNGKKKDKNSIPTTKIEKLNALPDWQKKLGITIAGTIIGAALGAICGAIGNLDKSISRKTVTGNRLMSDVLSNLKKSGLKEGSNFVRDPKMANLLKTKVCIAVTRSNGDLRILVNYFKDKKLEDLTRNIAKNTPNTGIKTQIASNNYNEITISTISDSSADATLVSRIAEQYIHSGYPVYLVEVG